ncbi:MAG: ribosome-binding factor [Candidatus Doudnabacteria bacterium]|nr:ribosome-binding factor [Candidatus Doudnabacteria bacterium]
MREIPHKKTNRVEKINALIQMLLGVIILPYTKDQGTIITISKVNTSKDLRWAKIWITVVDEEKDKKVLKTLQNNLFDIQGELNRLMEVKIIPRISFHLDTTSRYADHISQLFHEIEKEDQGRKNTKTDAE